MVRLPAANAVFEKLMLPDPAAAVTEPPQLLTTLGVPATTRLPGWGPPTVGKLSVKLASIGTTLPLIIEKVMVLALGPGPVPVVVWMVVGPKVLVMEGGCRMIMPVLAVPPLQVVKPPGA